jgi:hypothetical protein
MYETIQDFFNGAFGPLSFYKHAEVSTLFYMAEHYQYFPVQKLQGLE